jgi:hypothetical protein
MVEGGILDKSCQEGGCPAFGQGLEGIRSERNRVLKTSFIPFMFLFKTSSERSFIFASPHPVLPAQQFSKK